MTKTMNVSITNIPAISAIYYALLQSGYDYYSFGRTQEQIETIKSFYNSKLFYNFFSRTKQSTCKTYSYWPRAALLETAVFYMDADLAQFSDFESYKAFVMTASNLQDIERDENFWSWIADFPKELNKVINSESFNRYLIWENTWIEEQNKANTENLKTFQDIIKTCISHYNAKISNIKIALSPIKCAYSSDYHFVDGQFIFSSGEFKLESVTHEILHHIVHPMVQEHKDKIVIWDNHYDGIDSSYYHSDNDSGKMNAFEEFLVRSLTKEFLENTQTTDLKEYICKLLDEDEK